MADDKIDEEIKYGPDGGSRPLETEGKKENNKQSVAKIEVGATTMKNNFVEKATGRGQHDSEMEHIMWLRCK